MIWFIIIAVAVVVLVFFWRSYKVKYDTVIAYTGGLGSGKSYNSVKMSLRLLRKNRRLVKRHNKWEKFKHTVVKKYVPKIWEKPMLYASIPVRITRKEWAFVLTKEHLLLTKKLVPHSIVFIDEIGSFASQFEYDLPNLKDNFNEFVRFYRHYTFGGYLVVNDQCSENIVLYVRRRVNTVFNLMHFKKWFGLFYTVKVRNISISEEIKTIEEEDTEDNMTTLFGLLGFLKHYDIYCYSGRYKTVPAWRERVYKSYKKNNLLTVPETRVKKKTTDEEDMETVGKLLTDKDKKTA